MNAGRMDRRIRLFAPGGLVSNGVQRVPGAPVTLATIWAEFKPGRGSERHAMAQDQAETTVTWRIRYSGMVAGLDARHTLREVVDGELFGPMYDIKSVVELGRREGLEIIAAARAEKAGV